LPITIWNACRPAGGRYGSTRRLPSTDIQAALSYRGRRPQSRRQSKRNNNLPRLLIILARRIVKRHPARRSAQATSTLYFLLGDQRRDVFHQQACTHLNLNFYQKSNQTMCARGAASGSSFVVPALCLQIIQRHTVSTPPIHTVPRLARVSQFRVAATLR
jgi:hypothetical protein